MKKLRLQRLRSRPVIWGAITLLVLLTGLTWRLGTSPAGLAATESTQCQTGLDLNQSFINAPYFVVQSILPATCSTDSAFWVRLPSVLFAILAGLLFVVAVRNWFGRKAAVFGGLLFITASWFLHAGRLGSADVLWLLVVPFAVWLYQAVHAEMIRRRTVFIGIAGTLSLLYIPGGVWFVAIILSVLGKRLLQAFLAMSVIQKSLAIFLKLGLLAPFVYGFIQAPDQWQRLLGLPPSFMPMELLKQFAAVPLHLVGRGPEASVLWLGHRPVLDVFVTAMAIVGFIWFIRKSRYSRIVFICLLLAATWILAALRPTGVASLNLIVPLMYFMAAAGIQALLRRWFETFPRNPFAKWLAFGLITLAVGGSVLLNTREYFVAWPNSPITEQTFNAER